VFDHGAVALSRQWARALKGIAGLSRRAPGTSPGRRPLGRAPQPTQLRVPPARAQSPAPAKSVWCRANSMDENARGTSISPCLVLRTPPYNSLPHCHGPRVEFVHCGTVTYSRLQCEPSAALCSSWAEPWC